jgi:hypothetical protein
MKTESLLGDQTITVSGAIDLMVVYIVFQPERKEVGARP